MDTNRFDEILRSLASSSFRSRRRVLSDLTSGLLVALPLALGGGDAEAKNKKKKGKKKKKTPPSQPQPQPQSPPAFNAFGCLDVGQPCQGDGTLCCSGVCDSGTSTCVAHNSGICFADSNACTVGGGSPCHPTNSSCNCLLTTGNAAFCGDAGSDDGPAAHCRLCSSDTDCQEEWGPGAACVVLNGICTSICAATGRTACVRPCA